MSTRSPTLSEVILAALEDQTSLLHTTMPGRVESYDAATQSASVQPLIKREYDDEDGHHVETLPVVKDVPVAFPGAGAWRLTFPLAVGDTVLIVWTMASLERWLRTGGLVEPGDPRHHSASDAIVYPGVRDYAHALSGVSSSSLVLGNASVHVEVTGSEVKAGGSNALALAAALTRLYAAIVAAIGALGVGPASAQLAALKTALDSAGWPASGTDATTVLKGS